MKVAFASFLVVNLFFTATISMTHTITTNAPVQSERITNIPKKQTHQVIARSVEASATLLAEKKDGFYGNFILKVINDSMRFSDWENVDNLAYAPKIFFNDFNQDGEKDLLIVLTTGYGTGVLEQKAHILHGYLSDRSKYYEEIPVEDPLTIVHENVRSELSPHTAKVIIGDKRVEINIDKLQISPNHLFTKVAFGNIVRFDVKNSQLISDVGAQISPAGGLIGYIRITYVFRNNMYHAEKIEFNSEI